MTSSPFVFIHMKKSIVLPAYQKDLRHLTMNHLSRMNIKIENHSYEKQEA